MTHKLSNVLIISWLNVKKKVLAPCKYYLFHTHENTFKEIKNWTEIKKHQKYEDKKIQVLGLAAENHWVWICVWKGECELKALSK